MEFLTPAVVSGFIALAAIVAVFLLRRYLGDSEAKQVLDQAQTVTELMNQILKAAQVAVVEVEEAIKKNQDLPDADLKDQACYIALQILESWGVTVSPELVDQIAAVVEWAYQEMKSMRRVEDAYYAMPVLVEN